MKRYESVEALIIRCKTDVLTASQTVTGTINTNHSVGSSDLAAPGRRIWGDDK